MTTDTVGGVWTFTKELATELLGRGHEISLVSFGRLPSPEQRGCMQDLSQRYPRMFTYQASAVPLEWMQDNATAYEAGGEELMEVAATWQPQAYLFSQFCFGALPVAATKIVIAHSDVLSWAAACHEPLEEQNEWMQTYRTLVQRGLFAADAVVAPTRAYLSDLRLHFRDLPLVQAVIANGRTVHAAPAQPRHLRAVTAGRMWDKAKNLTLLQGITSALPLWIAGECDSFNAADSSNVQGIGMQTETQLLEIFRTSAVYLCTSVYEPFGLAPLEAALCGCAVVAMDIPSLREVWSDAALYFHDAASLTLLLSNLCSDEDLLRSAQQRSAKRAATFTAPSMADGYLALLSSLRKNVEESAHAA